MLLLLLASCLFAADTINVELVQCHSGCVVCAVSVRLPAHEASDPLATTGAWDDFQLGCAAWMDCGHGIDFHMHFTCMHYLPHVSICKCSQCVLNRA